MFRFVFRAGRRRAAPAAPTTARVTRGAIRPLRSRVVATALATVALAAAVATSGGPASARPVDAPAAQPAAAAAVCGFDRYWVRSSWFAVYNHCGPTTIRIHVDVSGGGSGNDYHLCVGPNSTLLGAGGNILNAYYIGGAGCPVRQRTAHTSH